MHEFYRLPGDEVLSNACVRLLRANRNIHRYDRHEVLLYHLLKSEHLSIILCDLCYQINTVILPVIIHLCVLLRILPMTDLHSHWQDPKYP